MPHNTSNKKLKADLIYNWKNQSLRSKAKFNSKEIVNNISMPKTCLYIYSTIILEKQAKKAKDFLIKNL